MKRRPNIRLPFRTPRTAHRLNRIDKRVLQQAIVSSLNEFEKNQESQKSKLDRKARRFRDSWFIVGIEALGFMGLFVAAFMFLFELKERQDERAARAWQLLTTQAPGNSGKRSALEYLNSRQGCLPFGIDLPVYGKCWKEFESLRGIHLAQSEKDENGDYLNEGVYLWDLLLPGAQLNGSNLFRAQLLDAKLDRVTAYNADWGEVLLDRASISDGFLYKTSLKGSRNYGTIYNSTCLYKVNFTDAYFLNKTVETPQNAEFKQAELYKSDFTNADLRAVDFSGAKLINIDVSGANLDGIVVDNTTQMDGIWAYVDNPAKNAPQGMTILMVDRPQEVPNWNDKWLEGYTVPPKCEN